ncbi:MAG TPA: DUF423 domain-containing protein [Rhodanobacteraceae bacterium]|nr:DUF423 domain-containing protein [Rhodanobacteraceae bacterium]
MSTIAEKVHGRLRWPGAAAAVAGASAVLLGALGAHALRHDVSAPMLDVWQTAVRFQFWHALALAVCALVPRRSHAAHLAAILFALGIVLFCGSLYALALGAPAAVGVVTPLGGLALVVGWIALGVALYRQQG